MFEIFLSARLRRLFLCETVLIVLVAVVSVRLRIGLGFTPDDPVNEEWPYWVEAIIAGVTIPVAVQLCMYYLGLYSVTPTESRTQLLVRLLIAHLLAGVALAMLYYLLPNYRVQRLALAMTLAVSWWLLFSLRFHIEEVLNSGTWRRRVLIIGTGRQGERLGHDLLQCAGSGYELAGWLTTTRGSVPAPGPSLLGRQVFGDLQSLSGRPSWPGVPGLPGLPGLIERHQIQDVVYASEAREGQEALMLALLDIKLRGVAVWSAPRFMEQLMHYLPIELLQPIEVVFDSGFEQSRFGLALKRGLDLGVSLLALLLLVPLFLLVAIAIRLDSRGGVFYRQERVGKGGKVFTIFKFRSMRLAAPGEKPRLTSYNDDRITRIGRFIRMHRIDELPQFLNVLLGDMSLVGPRPEVVYSVEELRRSIPFYDQRHAIKPGITSLGQVRFGSATTHEEARERLKYDLYYQKNMSLAFDLSILLDTVKVVLLGKGAR